MGKKKKNKDKKSKDQKKAEKQTKNFYDTKQQQTDQKAAMDQANLASDLQNILKDAGIATNNTMDDYLRNITAINQNKDADIASLNDYVKTNTSRTQEDLDTSLAKEHRRYQLQQDQTNTNLADTGLTFSDRKQEKIDAQENQQNTADINTVASRSFQDINRYEAAQNLQIQNKYGQQTAETEAKKNQSLTEIENNKNEAVQKNQQGQQGVTFQQQVDTNQNTYDKNDALSNIGNMFDSQNNSNKNAASKANVQG